jgi:hypothetical protein
MAEQIPKEGREQSGPRAMLVTAGYLFAAAAIVTVIVASRLIWALEHGT